MNLCFRLATPEDFPRVISMVRAFYVEDHITFDPGLVELGLRAVLAEPAYGAVLLLESDEVAEAGYITLGWCFSVEQGGRFVLLEGLKACR